MKHEKSSDKNKTQQLAPTGVETTTKIGSKDAKKVVRKELLVKFKRLNTFTNNPKKQSEGASGFDLHAAKGMSIHPGATVIVPCGIAVSIPPGYEGQIRPRSSMSAKRVSCALGTIDSDYRGELWVVLTNHSQNQLHVNLDDRIAQLVIQQVPAVTLEEVQVLDVTERAEEGFGSTGK